MATKVEPSTTAWGRILLVDYAYHLPDWTGVPEDRDGVFFVNKAAAKSGLPGFYLAIIKSGQYIVLEAFDTWLHPEITYDQFQRHVHAIIRG